MQLDRESFKKVFPSSFKRKLKESIVPFEKNFQTQAIIEELYTEISDNVYHPSKPREYIIANKHNYVARIIPTFEARDYFVYYLCIKLLEDEIAVNRVTGTYGGWTLGNAIRLREEDETFLLAESAPSNSFNPLLWMTNWQDFQKRAYQYSVSDQYSYFIKFDIANFYNSINLDLLIRKIYIAIPLKKRFYGELLSHFLHNWNKKLEGYVDKTIGLPQDEIGDCSRVLANFYLQEYDLKMSEFCRMYNAEYLRYADDQIIFCKCKDDARRILFEASKILFKSDLNLNSSKVTEYDSYRDFNFYWSFELFDLLADPSNKDYVNRAAEKYLEYRKQPQRFRDSGVLKKLVSVDFKLLKPEYRFKILSELLTEGFLAGLDWWWYKKIYEKLDSVSEQSEFLAVLDRMVDEIHFNSFHYNLKAFYKMKKLRYDQERVEKAIRNYSF
jgi:hypothetical protein